MSDEEKPPVPDDTPVKASADEESTGTVVARTQPEPITGQVARILTARELVINKGASDGVRRGMIFEVLDPKAEDIEDPETGEVLGSIDRPKIRVKITNVADRIAVARTYRSSSKNVGGYGGNVFGNLFEPVKIVRTYETLKTNEQTWEDLSEEESFVKTGDPVRQVFQSDD